MTRPELCKPVITGNYFDKYQSRNPVVKVLVRRFQEALWRLVKDLPVQSALEVGSGEGYLLSHLSQMMPSLKLIGSDITWDIVKLGMGRESRPGWCVAAAENLPFQKQAVDLLLCCEVLEHLEAPQRAMAEFRRLAPEYCIVSVPHEPLWRILNITRLKYWSTLGNTPGHIQHFSRHGIELLVSEFFEVTCVQSVVPWTFVLARKKTMK